MESKQRALPDTALQRLINAPKGHLDAKHGESFILHVFWEAPSINAARTLLEALRQCAAATHRDTPCVPTYCFRISDIGADLCSASARTVGDHPAVRDAKRKLQMGVPAPAVRADLVRRGLDPALVDLENASMLPEALQTSPVMVEFTELYLDERAFNEHVGSRDYLDAYGTVIQPSLQNKTPITIRLGTPTSSLVDKILESFLHERVVELEEGCMIWKTPETRSEHPLLMSLEFPSHRTNDVLAVITLLHNYCTSLVSFPHPLRTETTRVLCILGVLPPKSVLLAIANLNPRRGEAHVSMSRASEDAVMEMQNALDDAGLKLLKVTNTDCVGYVLHEKAADLHIIS
mmetsp:Transcript_1531/g.2333  ORF Transcript_1531/g.2333 Transcript_1531/m.2333 type:complete len:347 (-) Transcript_1531:58-1098(-)|eukprot:CAMPEP_0184676140 /NCGR_PEP_ID=MMETSP0308-20130426/88193_1 /TAXON_ID=38269 /ORGANISM="Gloeochaete witrockiana, Strain SAG 46.84" /LENGTH=346 /DNA_ID=CAMNT_0027123951 /DNA_START=126 /DNA_END=1166 /DNA_ORIENTATION=+